MSGFENDVMVAKNVNFDNTGPKPHLGIISTNGQLLIGSTIAPFIQAGVLTSPLGTITIGYSSPNITLDLSGGGKAIDSISVQTGTSPVTPDSNGQISLNGGTVAPGTNPVKTDGTGANTLTVEVQISQAIASADSSKIGLSNFNSAHFSVAATGFVSLANPSGFPWTDVTGATQTIAINNGYLTDRGGGVTYTLPATASIGDTFKIVGKLGLATITPNANQQLLIGSSSGAVGVTGTAVSNNVGDCITFVCITSGASTVWRADSVVGTWTLTT